jgi:outer membrane immunogenic protein
MFAAMQGRILMRKHSLMLLAAAFGLAASQASAADLPRKAPAYVPPPAPPPYVWTGCYIGGNVGGAWSDVSVSNNFTGAEVSRSNGGFAGGGQIGCDYQFAGGWVIGIRNLFDGTSISHTRDIDPLFFNTAFSNPRFETKVQWFDILTGRIGYLAQPNLLFYAQGGAAWAHAQAKFIDDFGEVARSKTSRTGWTAGGGVEWQFVPNWSVFLEYNYLGFQRDSGFTCGPVFCGNDVFTAKANIQTVLVGVNYRFGGIGKGRPY